MKTRQQGVGDRSDDDKDFQRHDQLPSIEKGTMIKPQQEGDGDRSNDDEESQRHNQLHSSIEEGTAIKPRQQGVRSRSNDDEESQRPDNLPSIEEGTAIKPRQQGVGDQSSGDEECQRHNQLPSIEEVRIYASSKVLRACDDDISSVRTLRIANGRCRLYMDRTISLDDRTISFEDQTTSLNDQTISLEDQTSSLEDQTVSFEDQTISLKDQTTSLEDRAISLEDQTISLEDQTVSLEDQTVSLKDPTSGLEIPTSIEEDSRTPHHQRRPFLFCTLLLFVVVLVAVAVTLAETGTNYSPNETPSQLGAATTHDRWTKIVAYLHAAGISDQATLETDGTPQHEAAMWMAEDDKLSYEIPSDNQDFWHKRFVQRYALAVFYFSLGGAQWNRQLFFLEPIHECAWSKNQTIESEVVSTADHGVTCERGIVKAINIPHNNLVGSLPSEMRFLTGLSYLSLPHNNIAGPISLSSAIPVHLLSHQTLQVLDLHSNNFQGSLPEDIPVNNKMKRLSFRDNSISGTIPHNVRNLESLTHLDLSGNLLEGPISDALGNIRDLQYLFLGDNGFEAGIIPDFLQDLTELRQLSLSNTHRNESIPSFLADLRRLSLLDLSENKLTGLIPEQLWELDPLAYVFLNRNSLSGPAPYGIHYAQNLSVLMMDHNLILGSLEATCSSLAKKLDEFVADCGEGGYLVCPCCTKCCPVEDDECNANVNALDFVPAWEDDFEPTPISLSLALPVGAH